MRAMPLSALLTLALLLPAGAGAIDLADTRLVAIPPRTDGTWPSPTRTTCGSPRSDGAGVRRLTSHPGVETGPRFSPDGTLVAFTGRYEGNVDVYLVPAGGRRAEAADVPPGQRRRARLHARRPVRPVLLGARGLHGALHPALHGPGRGRVPDAAAPSRTRARRRSRPTGRRSPTCRSRSRSTSGSGTAAARPRASCSSTTRPTPSSRCPSPPAAATTPTRCGWATGSYFRSDRDGEFNLYAFDRGPKAVHAPDRTPTSRW